VTAAIPGNYSGQASWETGTDFVMEMLGT
jgi:hypothetical protein